MPSVKTRNVKLEYTGQFPDQLKLVKTVTGFPFEVTAIGSLNPRTRQWNYSIGCRDVLLDGKITYNRQKSAIEYRKVLPFLFLSGLTSPVLAVEWQLGALSNWHKPRLQLGLAAPGDIHSTTDDGATLTSNGALKFRKKAFVTRQWGMEVEGQMRLTFEHDLSTGAQPGAVANSMGLKLAAKELNLVCRI